MYLGIGGSGINDDDKIPVVEEREREREREGRLQNGDYKSKVVEQLKIVSRGN